MAPRIKKLVLLAVMLVMPLQGVAATLSNLFCHDAAQLHALHDQGSHEHGVSHDGHQDEGGTTNHHTYHPCNHYTVYIPAFVTLLVSLPHYPVHAIAPDPLYDLFVPDRPQRPPLA